MFVRKRDPLIAFAVGSAIAIGLNIWHIVVAGLGTAHEYLWLSRLQEPGLYVAEKIAWSLYSRIDSPWNVRVAIPCSYAVLMLIWTVVIAAVLYLGRFAVAAVTPGPKAVNASDSRADDCKRGHKMEKRPGGPL